jgi:hypothetical protein
MVPQDAFGQGIERSTPPSERTEFPHEAEYGEPAKDDCNTPNERVTCGQVLDKVVEVDSGCGK